MEIKKSPKADLENKRGLFLEIGLVVALVLVIGAFAVTPKEHRIEKVDLGYAPVEVEIVEVTREDQKPPEAPKKVDMAVVSDMLEVVTNDTKIETEIDFAEFDMNQAIEVAPVQTEEVFEEEIFIVVEEKASFMGGDEGTFRNWVQQRVKYPAIAQENGIQEGNLSLITAIEMLDTADHGDEFLRREILQGIQALQETLEEEKKRDHRMVEKVSELDESITKLTEEMGRKITIEELSMFMDLPVDEIVSVMQLAGEDVEVGEIDPDEIFHVAGKDEMKETDQTVEEDSRENAQKMLENYAEKLTDGFDDMEYRPGE